MDFLYNRLNCAYFPIKLTILQSEATRITSARPKHFFQKWHKIPPQKSCDTAVFDPTHFGGYVTIYVVVSVRQLVTSVTTYCKPPEFITLQFIFLID